ncbi:ATP-dependent RNA helicase SrmB [Alteromonas macleodii]|jgi:ATP-dependent RNA helicase SrmB|uniref:ATP-dependent RNA helicase SrmB n=3 Tax=Alteromonas TaxID=226 RepID=A0A126PWQ2_ALTMA|nr:MULTISPECIES: ATP-dependent RNA helicase SrmB [Alteromonas]MBR05074.1 ATP-dependent RNA helicase SrmB [Alteromonas sp.]MCG8497835.1 ATP-dependent RNA helicase SrmB [Enterobacterales bacterium]MEC7283863.1 ATP-dependent RNA helicase SrmB [Pseudomonadota bacterium]NKX20310.1 ATP-dependent RNA helicase SrmB [Alteromonadaceae bacterium A_SAG2]NKX30202.1 ATP-dependent RNA helicase SrmB [Alteromonadaceae bacterium A_SAG1]|tara:strand:+ start:332 stop:1558 length:1227 start_codon:yes stop_codon:yes gene_type:complete
MTFEELELDEALCHAAADMGFETPTSIQELVIPHALDGRDILASAPTGTGKTAAFLLPACQFLLDYPRRQPGATRILILTPTRELALQVYEQALAITKHTQIVCGVITGGINYGTDKETLSKNLDILVATPGRLLEHIEKEAADCRDIECLILDEADRMLDMGFSTVVNQIAAEARWRKQNLLFSATLEGKGVKTFAHDILNNPEVIEANPSRKEKNKIHQWYHLADDMNHKQALLVNILKQETTTSAVVFVKTRERLQMLKDFLASKDIPVCWLQGEMPQDKRIAALARFKSGEVPILLATDVAARGIDVPNVSHVINFDMPRKADVYVHRIGRTGRAGAKGTAISLVEAHDFDMVAKTARYMGEPLKARVIDELRPKNKTPKIGPKKKKVKAKDKAKAKAKPKKKK